MSDLEKNIKAYEQEVKDIASKKATEFEKMITQVLPLAILFCNEAGQTNADKEQIKLLFEGDAAAKYQALNGGFKALELVDYLANYISKETGVDVNDVVIVTKAKEAGFDAIRLMSYFDHQFYLTTVEQASFVNKLGFVVEEDEYLDDYARQTGDKLWEIYDEIRNELSANGFTPEAMSQAYDQVSNIRYKEDSLRIEIAKLIDNLKHI